MLSVWAPYWLTTHDFDLPTQTDISTLSLAGATIAEINKELVKCRIVCHAHHAPSKAGVAVGVQRGHPVTFLSTPKTYVSLKAALDDHRVIKFRKWIADVMEGTFTGKLRKDRPRKRRKKTRCPYHDVAYETLVQTCLDTVCLRLCDTHVLTSITVPFLTTASLPQLRIHPTRLVEDAESKWGDSNFARGQLLVRMFYNLLKLVTGVCRTCGCVALPEDAQPSLLRFFEIDHGIYEAVKQCSPGDCTTVFNLIDEIARDVTDRDKRCYACFGGAAAGDRVVMCSLRCLACHRSGRLTKEEEDERASFEEAAARRREEGRARGAAARMQQRVAVSALLDMSG